jgi:CRP/FNR family transcriptional regulator, cyclic AMP receptor protein
VLIEVTRTAPGHTHASRDQPLVASFEGKIDGDPGTTSAIRDFGPSLNLRGAEGLGMTLLDEITAFKTVPRVSLCQLERGGIRIDPRDGAQIFAQGDPPDAIYAIVSGEGRVRIGSADRRGKRLMVEVFRAGDIFGEIGVIDGGARTADAYAGGRVSLLRIGASTFMTVLAAEPALGVSLCQLFANRLRRTFVLLEDAAFETLEVRLARQILYLAECNGRRTERGMRVTGTFRQADLADLLGSTTRSIITILNNWRTKGIVTYDTHCAQLTLCREGSLRALIEPEDQPMTPQRSHHRDSKAH